MKGTILFLLVVALLSAFLPVTALKTSDLPVREAESSDTVSIDDGPKDNSVEEVEQYIINDDGRYYQITKFADGGSASVWLDLREYVLRKEEKKYIERKEKRNGTVILFLDDGSRMTVSAENLEEVVRIEYDK